MAKLTKHKGAKKKIKNNPAPKGNQYALGNPGNPNASAPIKYKPEYCQMLIDFFSIPPMKEVFVDHFNKDGSIAYVESKKEPNDPPFFHNFATSIGIKETLTLNRWTEKYPEFNEAFLRAKELQKYFLISNGLRGNYNPTAFMFVAKNMTDMRDQQNLDITSQGKAMSLTPDQALKLSQRDKITKTEND